MLCFFLLNLSASNQRSAAPGRDARGAEGDGHEAHRGATVEPRCHLLASGIGDTIRISYANDPIYEVQDGLELCWVLGLRERIGAELIACPTYGRIQVDLFKLVQDLRKRLANEIKLPIKVAVMGCIVNGPGEAEGADVAIFAGDRVGIIYVQGQKVANVPEEQILDRLLLECKKVIK